MKKNFVIFLILLVIILGAGGVGLYFALQPTFLDGDSLEVSDQNFVTEMQAICNYENWDKVKGKTVTFEGMLIASEENGTTVYRVVRRGKACCSYDRNPGLDVSLVIYANADNGYSLPTLPITPYDDSSFDYTACPWVKVSGTVRQYVLGGVKRYILDITELTELGIAADHSDRINV